MSCEEGEGVGVWGDGGSTLGSSWGDQSRVRGEVERPVLETEQGDLQG